jgi:hypothetical protein
MVRKTIWYTYVNAKTLEWHEPGEEIYIKIAREIYHF